MANKDSSKGSGKLGDARKKAKKLGLGRSHYTLVVCMDRKTAKCCSSSAMSESWKYLKQRSKEWKQAGHGPVLRIKASCFGVCKSGPIIGVLPDGVWYGNCSPKVIDRIFDEHLLAGNVVHDHCIADPNA
jgi:(2Fe-2S) ferredoxin